MNSSCFGLFQDRNSPAKQYSSETWMDLVSKRAYKGIIFDCDGTLARSEDAHFKALSTAASEQGYELALDWYLVRTGLDRSALCNAMREEFSTDFDPKQAARRSMSAFVEHIDLVQPISCSHGFVEKLALANYKLAVGTNCETPLAKASVSRIKLLDHFSCIVSISDGLAPKPSPQIFETAAKRLKLEPNEVLVIEDSPQGVQAAMSANMDVLQLIHSG